MEITVSAEHCWDQYRKVDQNIRIRILLGEDGATTTVYDDYVPDLKRFNGRFAIEGKLEGMP